MSVLILGGTGFIGSNVASLFEQKGWKVYVLARNEEKARELRKKESKAISEHCFSPFTVIPIIATSAKDTQAW